MCVVSSSLCIIDNDSGDKQIYRLAPWGKHDLSIRCFADRSV